MNKKIISIALVLCMILSCAVMGAATASAADTFIAEVAAEVELQSTEASYGLASKVEDGNILHCFNWTLNQIKEELPNIAAAGFTSVQTSPLQPHTASGAWYWLYQPTDSTIGNEIGSYNDLKNLCSEADKYGIKVVVDVVANHLAGWNDGRWNDAIAGSWRNSEYFHNQGECSNWDNRYDVTHKNIGMPDLNSENETVQNKWVEMVKSLKSAGVDGVRWDAAKHIGLPSEGCGFWSKIAAQGMFNYGEILDNPAGNSGDDYNNSLMKEYGSLIGVTDSSFSGHITGCIRDGRADGSWTGKWTNAGVPANRVVYWAESHDTYCNNGWTNSLDENIIDRSYAVLGARAGSQALYMSRPFERNHNSIMYARKGSTHFTSKQVAAVNHFHNAMVGTGEYFTADNGCFVVCRGGGAVIVSPNGSNFDITVKNGGGMVPAGTYTDEVSGSTWTVNGSSMSGHIGSSGIAVIYNQPAAGPSAYANPGNSTYKTDTLTVTLGFTNADSGSFSIDGGSFKSYTNGQTITIGQGAAYGTTTKLTVKATKGSATDQATYTYTKVDPNATPTIYFDNSKYGWSEVWCYVYADQNGNIISNGSWPGEKMIKSSNNIYYYDVPLGLENGRAIFTENSGNNDHRYPGDGDPGLDINGISYIFGENRSWTPYTGPRLQPENPQNPTDPVVPTPSGKVLIGDADQDNSVTIYDATRIQRHLAELVTLTGNALSSADADEDRTITIYDATAIQRYLAELPTSAKNIGKYSDGSTPVNPENPTTSPYNPTPGGKDIVFTPGDASVENPAWYAWVWKNGEEGQWVKGDDNGTTVIFAGAAEYDNILVARMPTGSNDPSWESCWNQSEDCSITGTNLYFTGWGGGNKFNIAFQ